MIKDSKMSVHYVVENEVGVITLDDQPMRNALTVETVSAALAHLEENHQKVRGFVIASAGKLFCAGADIRAFTQGDTMPGRDVNGVVSPLDLFKFVWSSPVPVVAAPEGGAYGGGAELCCCCDAVICGPNAFLCFPEVGLGAYPTTAAYILPGTIGRNKALEWLSTRRKIPAQEALEAGMVRQVAAEGQAVQTAITYLRQITGGAGLSALREMRLAIKGPLPWGKIVTGLETVDENERLEGAKAFKERRKPDYPWS
jgi:enoyl-CoA hydratase